MSGIIRPPRLVLISAVWKRSSENLFHFREAKPDLMALLTGQKVSQRRVFGHGISLFQIRISHVKSRRNVMRGADCSQRLFRIYPIAQFIVGMTNSAPSLTPDGQREVTVLVLV